MALYQYLINDCVASTEEDCQCLNCGFRLLLIAKSSIRCYQLNNLMVFILESGCMLNKLSQIEQIKDYNIEKKISELHYQVTDKSSDGFFVITTIVFTNIPADHFYFTINQTIDRLSLSPLLTFREMKNIGSIYYVDVHTHPYSEDGPQGRYYVDQHKPDHKECYLRVLGNQNGINSLLSALNQATIIIDLQSCVLDLSNYYCWQLFLLAENYRLYQLRIKDGGDPILLERQFNQGVIDPYLYLHDSR